MPSASLILDDPTLLFVNAGMVPFKLPGQAHRSRTASRRPSGACAPISKVGITTRHNTLFQMAGNFSFGQYFKECDYARVDAFDRPVEEGSLGLDPERLWVTVYTEDDEAAEIWEHKIGVPAERIQRMGMEDNFWSMGIPGPCGLCSEISRPRIEYGKEGGPTRTTTATWRSGTSVHGVHRGAGDKKGGFEILGELPNKNIDTGLGVERVACILQGVDNVYELTCCAR